MPFIGLQPVASATSAQSIDGVTSTATELNYTDGVTSNIQTQLDSKVGASYTGDVDITGELLVDSYNETFKRVTSSSNAAIVNCENANVFEHVLTENTTFTFSSPPASGAPASTFYDIDNASYDSVSFDLSTQEASPQGVQFKPDGTKMFIIGTSGDDINEYTLSTAWNVSTATYDSNFSLSSQDLTPYGFHFNNDGTKFFVTGGTNDSVFQYSCSTAYDISTASYDSVSLSVSSQDTGPFGIEFKPDGTKMYLFGLTNETVFQYSLTTAFDLSTASYESKSFDASTQTGTTGQGFVFNGDGTKAFINNGLGDIYQYSLSTAYDVSTMSYDSVTLDVGSSGLNIDSQSSSIQFKTDGTKMYLVGNSNDSIFQFTTTTSSLNDSTAYAMSLKIVQDASASGYTVTWPTSVDWPSATAPTLTATASAVDQFVFYTYDGGTTWYGFTAGQALG